MSEAAYTQTPDKGMAYPGYVNFQTLDDGRVKITVRASQLKGPGAEDQARPGELAQLVIEGRAFVQLMEDADKLQLPEAVMDEEPTMTLPFAGDAWPGGKAEGAKTVFVREDSSQLDGPDADRAAELPAPQPIEPAAHPSDAIVVDQSEGESLEELIEKAEQKHHSQ